MYARRMCLTIFVFFFFFYKNITIFIASNIASLFRSLIQQLSLIIILIVRVIKFIRIYLVPSSKDKKDRHLTNTFHLMIFKYQYYEYYSPVRIICDEELKKII